MIRHIVLLKLKEETTSADLENIKTTLQTMPSEISEIAQYSFGQDLSVSDNTADLAIVADFKGIEDFKAYSKHLWSAFYACAYANGTKANLARSYRGTATPPLCSQPSPWSNRQEIQ